MNRQDRRQKGGNVRLSTRPVNPNAAKKYANPLIFHQKPAKKIMAWHGNFSSYLHIFHQRSHGRGDIIHDYGIQSSEFFDKSSHIHPTGLQDINRRFLGEAVVLIRVSDCPSR